MMFSYQLEHAYGFIFLFYMKQLSVREKPVILFLLSQWTTDTHSLSSDLQKCTPVNMIFEQ